MALNLKTALALVAFFFAVGCGVKGDPLPPERPPELGRGRPTFRRATEKIKLQKPDPSPEDGDEQTEDDE